MSSLQDLEFLQTQSRCITYIFEHIEVLNKTIKEFKKRLKNGTLQLNPNCYILKIENKIKQIQLLINDFNQGDFLTIIKEQVDEQYSQLIYGSIKQPRRKKNES